jgi:hypothetical protein
VETPVTQISKSFLVTFFQKSNFFLLLAVLSASPAAADSICVAAASAPPAQTISVTCDEAAISRYFLLSPSLAALTPAQRAQVITDPTRYALAYMSADAANRLQAAFASPTTQSVDLNETLTTRGPTGQPQGHNLFRIAAGRADVANIDWSKLAPLDLFKTVPTQLSPYLLAQLKADSEK